MMLSSEMIDLLHMAVSGLLVFPEGRVVKVHLLQSQEALTALLSDLSEVDIHIRQRLWPMEEARS